MNRPLRRIITVDDERLAARCARGRVVVIDDDPEVLQALGALIAFEGYAVDCHASAPDYLAARAADAPSFPGPVCLLCDVNMPALSGLELQQQLLAQDEVAWLLMSGVSGAQEAASAFRAGAVDFLVKPIPADTLLQAIERALQTSSRKQAQSQQQAELLARQASLTEREQAVLRLLASGLRNQAIAAELDIALRTVKLHRHNGMHKLGAQSVADLVRLMDRLEPPA